MSPVAGETPAPTNAAGVHRRPQRQHARRPGRHRHPGKPAGLAAAHARVESGGFRRDVEGLRGLAVALVVLYHAGVPRLTGGFVGVDVFFVLSGFLITGLLVDELRAAARCRCVASMPAGCAGCSRTGRSSWW